MDKTQKMKEPCDSFEMSKEVCAQQVKKIEDSYEELVRQNKKLAEQCELLQNQYKECKKKLRSTELMARNLRSSYMQMKGEYNDIISSRGWRVLNKWYTIREVIFPRDSIIRKFAKVVARLLLGKRQEIDGPNFVSAQTGKSGIDGFKEIKLCRRIDILTVPHTMYLAKTLKDILDNLHIECNILTSEPEEYEDIPYIIICPQIFKRFPEIYVAMQMEQTINSRWLTEEYMDILHNAYAVFDYSLENINFFNEDPLLASKLYYMPVDVCAAMMQSEFPADQKEYDVLFYGDINNERRKVYLKAIGEEFKLHIASEVYGEDLYAEMNKAKIVINVHYYEDALLETTRLYETLSVSDCLIISERSGDPREEAALEDVVDFVEVGNVGAMVERIRYWLAHEDERTEKVAKSREFLKNRVSSMQFYLYRFLLANDRITFDRFYEDVGGYVYFNSERVCLSLPESTERRADFDADNVYGFEVCPGLKHRMGWIGCGMSYKFMLRKAMEQQMERILICEDDVYFPPDFEERFGKVLDYVNSHNDWTVFSGIMADLGQVTPLNYVEENGEEYIYLDKMISMVFNIYDKSVFEAISNWDNMNRDIKRNTIDRFLEKRKMRILTTCPFLVGHKEDLQSTIWGRGNGIYTQLIENSSIKLREVVNQFKKNRE